MGLLACLKQLFSAANHNSTADTASKQGKVKPSATEEYQGFTISAAPAENQGLFRISGTISKGDQCHTFDRADQFTDKDLCSQEMLRKARQMIDQQGDALFTSK